MGQHASTTEEVKGNKYVGIDLSGITQSQNQLFWMILLVVALLILLKLWMCWKHFKDTQFKLESRAQRATNKDNLMQLLQVCERA
ncbi:unknown [African cichlid nackednavirus]|nr:unknown [African cichlid nackednavirus]